MLILEQPLGSWRPQNLNHNVRELVTQHRGESGCHKPDDHDLLVTTPSECMANYPITPLASDEEVRPP
jgi:hypothetical protein